MTDNDNSCQLIVVVVVVLAHISHFNLYFNTLHTVTNWQLLHSVRHPLSESAMSERGSEDMHNISTPGQLAGCTADTLKCHSRKNNTATANQHVQWKTKCKNYQEPRGFCNDFMPNFISFAAQSKMSEFKFVCMCYQD